MELEDFVDWPFFNMSSSGFYLGVTVLLSVRTSQSQVANPHNAFCIEQRTAATPKEAQVRVFPGDRCVLKVTLRPHQGGSQSKTFRRMANP